MLFSERKELADKADQWMEEKHVGKTSLGVISYLDAMGWLNEEPSISPERKKGEWMDLNFKDEMWGQVYECSICGEMMIGQTNYCFNCGADMRGW